MERVCSVEGCGKPAACRALCWGHYHRLRAHGDPTAGKAERGKPQAFLEAAIASDTDDCILWPYGSVKGYAKVYDHARKQQSSASQAVLERTAGPKPSPDHVALHAPLVCNEPSCINPRHLRWGTALENQRDRLIDGTDLRGSRLSQAKLTERDVRQIRAELGKTTQADLGRRYGVTINAIWCIAHGRSWRHVR